MNIVIRLFAMVSFKYHPLKEYFNPPLKDYSLQIASCCNGSPYFPPLFHLVPHVSVGAHKPSTTFLFSSPLARTGGERRRGRAGGEWRRGRAWRWRRSRSKGGSAMAAVLFRRRGAATAAVHAASVLFRRRGGAATAAGEGAGGLAASPSSTSRPGLAASRPPWPAPPPPRSPASAAEIPRLRRVPVPPPPRSSASTEIPRRRASSSPPRPCELCRPLELRRGPPIELRPAA
ncbi:unnamed protein product [Urochloa humidicola]